MADNTLGDAVYTELVTCTASDQQINLLQSRSTVYIIADGDCFVNFDKAVTTNGRFLIKANEPYHFEGLGGVRTIHYLDDGSGASLYVMAAKPWNS